MKICLPIAEISVDAFLMLCCGGLLGVPFSMFGVNSVFYDPAAFFAIPPAVVVATETNQIVASSLYRALEHFRRTAAI